jgi:hypothetical protein
MKTNDISRAAIACAGLILAGAAWGQQPGAAAAPKLTPQQASPIDLTGVWVSIVNEEWRWRMLTPPKGDYASVPLNPAGKAKADTWDVSQDGSCKAVGAAALLRMPTRLKISWAAPDILKIESDTGVQTRLIYFNAAGMAPVGTKSLQGRSLAVWEFSRALSGGMGFPPRGRAPAGGDLKVVTTDLAEGWLRRNGVPYSDKVQLTEFFDRFPTPDGHEWFVVTTQVIDPTYLQMPFITSSHFRREADASRWHLRPCKG